MKPCPQFRLDKLVHPGCRCTRCGKHLPGGTLVALLVVQRPHATRLIPYCVPCAEADLDAYGKARADWRLTNKVQG